ncbi:MAG: hypothetical protein JWO03_2873 [Bacteroidetes bacterium]|nr:hypothetical protein [Bacteroidota bacterium]
MVICTVVENLIFLECSGHKAQVILVDKDKYFKFLQDVYGKAYRGFQYYSIALRSVDGKEFGTEIWMEMISWYLENRVEKFPKRFNRYKLNADS